MGLACLQVLLFGLFEQFDPIVLDKSNQDMIPHMVYERNVRDEEFGGMYCAVLTATLSQSGLQWKCCSLGVDDCNQHNFSSGHDSIPHRHVSWALCCCRFCRARNLNLAAGAFTYVSQSLSEPVLPTICQVRLTLHSSHCQFLLQLW